MGRCFEKTMKEENNTAFDSEDELRAENEAKKIKLQLEHGMTDFGTSGNLDAGIESEFLDQVIQFEDAYRNAKRTTVYKFIGSPEYRAVGEITGEHIAGELGKIHELLQQNNLSVDNICPVDDREMYRFITEELFQHEMDDIRIPGMKTCFTYEEFHPNTELDLKSDSELFLYFFFRKEPEFYMHHLAQEIRDNNWFINFSNAFDSFTMNEREIMCVQHDEKNATVTFLIDFTGKIEGMAEGKTFKGEGKLYFQFNGEYWYIQEVVLPV